MKAYLDCYPCFLTQALKTARFVTSDEKTIRQILDEVGLALAGRSFDAPPPVISQAVYRIIAARLGVQDPYREIKKACIGQALSLYPRLKRLIAESPDRLWTAVKLAIAGNVIDFGANADFDLKRDVDQILAQDPAVNHFPEFRKMLDKAGRILYLADNAGETVFDRLFIEELQKPVIYAVRGSPIINDALYADAVESGIGEVARIISSGVCTPGTVLAFCSHEFLETYRSADLIISKGQGNFEALSDEDRPIFFLLKIKCDVVARHLGRSKGDIVLMSSKAGRSTRPG
jgi:uncharacterized protein with ATP-grasp and redox domains